MLRQIHLVSELVPEAQLFKNAEQCLRWLEQKLPLEAKA